MCEQYREPFFNEKVEICRSHKQYTRPIDSVIANKCVDVESGVGTVHSAWDPLAAVGPTGSCVHVLLGKRKKIKNKKHKHKRKIHLNPNRTYIKKSQTKHSLVFFVFVSIAFYLYSFSLIKCGKTMSQIYDPNIIFFRISLGSSQNFLTAITCLKY